jgi:hypothetical protein
MEARIFIGSAIFLLLSFFNGFGSVSQ